MFTNCNSTGDIVTCVSEVNDPCANGGYEAFEQRIAAYWSVQMIVVLTGPTFFLQMVYHTTKTEPSYRWATQVLFVSSIAAFAVTAALTMALRSGLGWAVLVNFCIIIFSAVNYGASLRAGKANDTSPAPLDQNEESRNFQAPLVDRNESTATKDIELQVSVPDGAGADRYGFAVPESSVSGFTSM